MKLRILPAAHEDLHEIWLFGCREWSRDRANRYSSDLMGRIGRLTENPLLAPPAPDLNPGYRRMIAGAHVVFYRVEGDVVEVVRVLHQSRDAGRVRDSHSFERQVNARKSGQRSQ